MMKFIIGGQSDSLVIAIGTGNGEAYRVGSSPIGETDKSLGNDQAAGGRSGELYFDAGNREVGSLLGAVGIDIVQSSHLIGGIEVVLIETIGINGDIIDSSIVTHIPERNKPGPFL